MDFPRGGSFITIPRRSGLTNMDTDMAQKSNNRIFTQIKCYILSLDNFGTAVLEILHQQSDQNPG